MTYALSQNPGLHAHFMPFRALIKRELLTTLRSPKPYAFMALLVLFGCVGFSLALYTLQADGSQFSAQASRNVFTTFVAGLYIAGTLLIPPLAAVSVCVEKQQGNLELLKITFATPATIATAKIFGVMGIYTLLLAAVFPFFGVLFFFAGLDAPQVVCSTFTIYAGSLAAAAVGVACSALCRRTIPAILSAIIVVFILQYGLLGFVVLARETYFEGTALAQWSIRHKNTTTFILSPLALLFGVVDGVVTNVHFIAGLLLQSMFVCLGWLAAIRFLRREDDNATTNPGKLIGAPNILETRRRSIRFLLPEARHPLAQIRDQQNPVYAAERRLGMTGRVHWRVWFAVAFGAPYFILCAWYVFRMGIGIASVAPFITPIILCAIVLLCIAPAIIAPAMAREYEHGNIDMLRTTLLRPRDIAAGKLLAALTDLAPLVASMIVGSIPLLIAGYDPLANDVIAVAVILPYSLALIVAAAWGARSTAASLIRGYGAVLLAHAVIPFAALAALDLTTPGDSSFPADHSGLASFLSPLLTRIYIHERSRYLQDSFELDLYLYWNLAIFAILAIPIAYAAWCQFQRQFYRSNP